MMKRYSRCLLALAAALMVGSVVAQTTYTDNFQGGSANLKWTALGDACLTAGNGSGSIPACSSSIFPADPANQGALLLTPAKNDQTGAILSAFAPFPLSQGIQITFTTYTFGGDSGGTAKNGADGIVFILTDGTQTQPTTPGAEGGSMGYGCSNGNGVYDGIVYGYLGLGIDEYGNFLNSGDNGSQGIYNSNDPSGTTSNGSNTYYNSNNGTIAAGTGPQYQPERIGLRGAGNTNWTWLQAQNPNYYSGSSSASLVQAACRSGQYVSGGAGTRKSPYQYTAIPYNYNPIPNGYAILPNGEPIANNSSSATRNPSAGTAACVGNKPSCTIAWPITYKLSISSKGLLNFAYSYNNGAFQPVLANTDITKSNGPLPASLRFGFSAGTGGSNNVHEITCFQASPLTSTSSAAANTIQSGQVKTGTQIYLAAYSNNNWWGSMQAVALETTNGVLAANNVATWDGKCVLTGGGCDSMGTDAKGSPVYSVTVQAPSTRTLLTSSGSNVSSGGEPLEWGGSSSDANANTNASGNITSAQQAILNTNSSGTVDGNGQIRLDWLRGDRMQEQGASTTAALRSRTYVLGDIIDSSPTWVGAPNANYPNAFSDGLYGSTITVPENGSGAQTYGAFTSNNATRLNVVYVGGNDGILHGFEAGYFNSSGNFSDPNGTGTGNNDGKELIGYMPADVLANKSVSLTNPTYVHDYMVDATPAVGDLFYNNAWHTWLVGGVGSTGKEIYALDVTNPGGSGTPQGPSFSEANAGTLVVGDWDSSNASLSHLGNTVGSPIVARMHNGQWAIIFGNGLGSVTSAGIYIGLVSWNSTTKTPTVTFQFLDTKVGSSTSANGISYVTSVDLDGDNIADYLYAGDLQGNVWRFDVTSSTASSWTVSTFGNKTPTPLFVAKDSSGNLQPITTAIVAAGVQTGTVTRAMLYFGTGQKTPQTTTSGDMYNTTGTQSFYGIWDWDMSNWNSLSSVKYASLAEPQSFTSSNLLVQTSTQTTTSSGSVNGYRYLSTGTVCWQGSSACASGNTQFGWMYNLPDTNEQIIYNPTVIGGAIVVNTAVPPMISATQCIPNQQTGWTMSFDAASGGALAQGFFPVTPAASGEKVNGVGTPTAVTYNGQTYLVTQTVTSTPSITRVNPPTNTSTARVSWREIRN
ncbi:MAG TPA: PilC/PilY family type IV pilus protein [Candidatus Saccharimonadales bacterium]|nr:PilC/PilY family type IV pilus protein [Candidatus Saccharimonadales bacterium]